MLTTSNCGGITKLPYFPVLPPTDQVGVRMLHPRDQASTRQLECREQILILKLKWYFLQVVVLTLQKLVWDMLFPILSKMGFFYFYYWLTDSFISFVLWLVFYPSSYFCISRNKFENCSLVLELGFYLIVLKINKQIKTVLSPYT